MSGALTTKQQVFLEHYLTTWNATEAARVAGYAFPNVEGPKNLVKPSIAAAIKARLSDMTMTADEVLVRLADQARADMNDFVTDLGSSVRLDLQKAIKRNKMHLVKKFSVTRQGTSVELYDAQAALVHIGKHHGLFVERHEHEHSGTIGQHALTLERRVLDLVEREGTYQVPEEPER